MRVLAFKILAMLFIFLVFFTGLFSPATKEGPPRISEINVLENSSSTKELVGEATSTVMLPEKATSTPPEEKTEEKKLPSPSTPPVSSPPKIKPPLLSFPILNEALRSTAVNIFCVSKSSGPFAPISGSGVFIDPRGVVLTNAHIGQYFLLKDLYETDFLDCVIRSGSPATPKYRAKLMYLPPSWIEEDKQNINAESPTGTGEEDYALLFITNTVGDTKLPESFPFVEPSILQDGFVDFTNDGLLIAAYSSGFLGGIETQKDLFLTSTTLSPKNFFTFKSSTVDLISFGGSIVAQKGSSGAGIFSRGENALIGIVVTSTTESSTENRDLRAITIAHIDRSLSAHTGLSLREYLRGDLSQKVESFNENLFDTLKETLVLQLKK